MTKKMHIRDLYDDDKVILTVHQVLCRSFLAVVIDLIAVNVINKLFSPRAIKTNHFAKLFIF